MNVLDSVLKDVREDVLLLMEESSDRAVLEAVVNVGAPVFIAYKTRGLIPDARDMRRIATYLLALAVAQEDAREVRRNRYAKENDR